MKRWSARCHCPADARRSSRIEYVTSFACTPCAFISFSRSSALSHAPACTHHASSRKGNQKLVRTDDPN